MPKSFTNFSEAISDCDFIVGTTAKKRGVKEDYLSIRDLPKLIHEKGNTIKKVAIVFGREDTGLRNEELKACDLVSTVPLQTTYPSLNLAQSIMLYAYELSVLKKVKNEIKEPPINIDSFHRLKEKSKDILLELGFKEESAILPRIIERLNQLKESDIHLFHSITNKYLEKKN